MKLILASGSSYRRELLSRLGARFDVVPADVDESRHAGESAEALAVRLAQDKARAVAASHPQAWVIGSDQVAAIDEDVLNKPGNAVRATEQLRRLSGRTHRLITAVCVVSPKGEGAESMVHDMAMRELSDSEIAAYLALDEPFDCAGSYKIEAGGIRLFEALRGDDYTGIVGLPLTSVRRLLDQLGFEWDWA